MKNLCITEWYLILINIISFIKIIFFCQGHSSHHALITLVNKITGDMVIGIFLDLKKAFDTVNHKNWFKSYLENRSQNVTYNEKRSDIKDVICGVPQGSILGTLSF